MTTKICFFIPNGCSVYPEMCKQVKSVIVEYFGKKHAIVDEFYSFVTVEGCEVMAQDLDAIAAKINKNIELVCIVNPESSQLAGRFITLNMDEK